MEQIVIEKVKRLRYDIDIFTKHGSEKLDNISAAMRDGAIASFQKVAFHQRRVFVMEIIIRVAIISGFALFFMYTYQAFFITQKNVIESLIETLAIKDGQQ